MKKSILKSIRIILIPLLMFLIILLFLKIGTGTWGGLKPPQEQTQGKEATDPSSMESLSIGNSDDASLSVHIIDVGQGSAALFNSGDEWMLFDGGDRQYSQKVVAYLKERNVDRLKYVIASHYDSDHISGIVGVLNTIPVENIFGPTYEANTRTYYSLMNKVRELGLTMVMPDIGSTYTFGKCIFTVLAPLKEYEEENANSIAIRLVCEGKSIYIAGDQTEESETDMLLSSLGAGIKSDVLIVSHHGSASSSSSLFLGAVRPKVVIISCGKNNDYGHPAKSVMNRLQLLGANLYRTDMQGDILFQITSEGLIFKKEPINDYTPGTLPVSGMDAKKMMAA